MNIYLKSFIFLLIFSILHFGYEITGWKFLIPFCGINESVFQHLKMGFWAYLLLIILIEYPVLKRKNKKIISLPNFWYSRLLSLIIMPWVLLIVWYLLPAIYGKVKIELFEALWSIGVTYLSSLFVEYIEKDTEKTEFNLTSRYIILFLVFVLAFLFIRFTYKLPWIDLFINPESI